MTKVMERNGIMIAVLSGKGGVGKTSICLSMGSILSFLGKKVLIIDYDFATHGLTYFFLGKMNKNMAGMIELINDPNLKPDIINFKSNFHILPSTSKITGPDLTFMKNENINSSNVFKNLIEKFKLEYDYILIDCQAGAVPSIEDVIKLSEKVLIVAEADPISVWAIKNIEYEFGKMFPAETFGLINKLFIEEKERYKDFREYSRLMKFLPPLPFDMEVRRNFARRHIPADVEKPSEFLISLLYAINDLLPELEENISNYLKKIKALNTQDIKMQIKENTKKIDDIKEVLFDLKYSRKNIQIDLFKFFSFTIATLGVAISIFAMIASQLRFIISTYLIIVISSLIIAGSIQIFYLWLIRKRKNEKVIMKKMSNFENELEELMKKKEKLEILLFEREKPFL
jgi:cellulose biosynthesis protein BcsQ